MADPTVKPISIPLSKEDEKSAWLITEKWLDHNEKNGGEHDVEKIEVKVDGYNGDKGPFFARMEMTTNKGVVLHYFCSDKRELAQSIAEALQLLSNVVVEGNPGGPETLRSA